MCLRQGYKAQQVFTKRTFALGKATLGKGPASRSQHDSALVSALDGHGTLGKSLVPVIRVTCI